MSETVRERLPPPPARTLSRWLALAGLAVANACGVRPETTGAVPPPRPTATGETDVPIADPVAEGSAGGAATGEATDPPDSSPGLLADAPPRRADGEAPPEEPVSASPTTHCIVLSLADPTEAAADAIADRLRGEGLDAEAEGSLVTLRMDEETIRHVFGARTEERSVAASASIGFVEEAVLVGGTVPRAWRDDVRGFDLGYQICE